MRQSMETKGVLRGKTSLAHRTVMKVLSLPSSRDIVDLRLPGFYCDSCILHDLAKPSMGGESRS